MIFLDDSMKRFTRRLCMFPKPFRTIFHVTQKPTKVSELIRIHTIGDSSRWVLKVTMVRFVREDEERLRRDPFHHHFWSVLPGEKLLSLLQRRGF